MIVLKWVALTLTLFFSSLSALANQNVLFIHSYDTQHKWVQFINDGFSRTLSARPDIHVFIEYMDVKRFPKSEHQTFFYQFLLDKYQHTRLDAIVVADDSALNLFNKHQNDLFKSLPLIYMGINQVSKSTLNIPNATGVFENRDLESTMVDIKKTFSTDELVVIADSSLTGQTNLNKIKAALGNPNVPQKTYLISELNASDITKVFQSVPESVPVLIVGQLIEDSANGAMMEWTHGIAALSAKINNPLISIGIISLEKGAVAAHELDGSQHAEKAAAMLLKVLKHQSTDNVAPITKEVSTWYFHKQIMKEYGLREEALPANTRILYSTPSFLQQNKNLLLAFGSLLLVASIIILLLLALIRKGKEYQKVLKENESRYRDLALEGAHVFWESDCEGLLQYISGDSKSILGFYHGDMQGKILSELLQQLPKNNFSPSDFKDLLEAQRPIRNLVIKYSDLHQHERIVAVSGKPLFSDNSNFIGYRGIIKDISEEYKLTQQVMFEARHDSLTGLINRHTFNEQCREAVKSYKANNSTAFICFLDLDRFKMVNDTIGHMAGDAMLAELARKIEKQLTSQDTLGRLGGDEFGLIIKNKSASQAMSICQNIITCVNEYRMYWKQSYYSVGVSIGMVEITAAVSYLELLSHADIACYKAKEQGRGQVYYASCGDVSLLEEQQQLGYIANINHALENGQFFFAKQLISPLSSSNNTPHYEILLRYNDQSGHPIPPNIFIPSAEKYGVITLIDLWVFQQVLNRYDQLFDGEGPIVSINLSGVSLSSEEFTQQVIEMVENSSLDMRKICFEITETSVISHIESAISFIVKLKKFGCRFALDDFGSGSSSYGYLKKLPVDYLKIDGSLVQSLASEEIDKTIVKSINDTAHSMGIKTVAEFVEDEEILSILQEIGVDYGQGYGIHKPEIIHH
ncbi:EAL domain-containing protein [Marinomonas epiphytica]